ncbi:MAG: hypothetical protein ACRELY_13540, partial [Polyangiaceae bacterium]
MKTEALLFALFLAGSAIVVQACGSDDATSPQDGGEVADDSDGNVKPGDAGRTDATVGDGGTCDRTPSPDDHVRNVVVSHPFDEGGNKTNVFELLTLDTSGTLTRTGTFFDMGTALDSNIVFTPDGKVALVAQDDGSIGVVRFDASGPVVVLAAFTGPFYATAIVMEPSGKHAYVLDADTADNGGGVYAVDIACDGTLTSEGLVVPGGTADQMAFVPSSTRAVLSAGAAFDSPDGSDTHLVDFDGTPSRVASGNGFVDGGAIVSSVAVMPDGKFAVAADNGLLVGNRVAVISLPDMQNAGLLAVPNPAAVVASPYDNAALILSSDGMDAIRLASYSPDASTPLSIVGPITY